MDRDCRHTPFAAAQAVVVAAGDDIRAQEAPWPLVLQTIWRAWRVASRPARKGACGGGAAPALTGPAAAATLRLGRV